MKPPNAYCPVCGSWIQAINSRVSVQGELERSLFVCSTCDYAFDLSGLTIKRIEKVRACRAVGEDPLETTVTDGAAAEEE